MNPPTIIVLCIVILLVVAVIAKGIWNKRHGKHSCSCGSCGNCPVQCGKKKEEEK